MLDQIVHSWLIPMSMPLVLDESQTKVDDKKIVKQILKERLD